MANKRISDLPVVTSTTTGDVVPIDGATTRQITVENLLGDNVQSIKALTSAADKVSYFTGAGTSDVADFTPYGRSVVAVADEAAFKALTNLEIGTDVQAYSSSLDAVSGTNTGDQTITLTGDVTGTGTGSFATTISATAVTSSMLNSDVFSTAHSWSGQQTFVAPVLGTPASGVATNLTGTASGLTAGNVTTNANLTGDVTSVGNATTIGATKVTSSMLNSDVFSTAHSWGGVQTFTNPVVGTQTAGDNSTKAASTAFVTAAVVAAGGGDMLSANNLSDVADVATARSNLGLSVLPWPIVGLVPYNDPTTPTTTLGVSPGSAVDSLNAEIIHLASGITKRIDAAWASGTGNGGLDTGTVAAFACYHIFVIVNASGTVDVLFSLSATAPTLPTGYSKYRRIGAFRVDGSSHIYPGIWYPNGEFIFYPPVTHAFPAANAVALFTTFGPVGIKAKVKYRFVANDTAGGNPGFTIVFIDPAVGSTAAPSHYSAYKSATISTVPVVEAWTDTLARAYAGGGGSATSAFTSSVIIGWLDLRNENQ